MKSADIMVGQAYAKGSPASFKGQYPSASYVVVLDDSGDWYRDSWMRRTPRVPTPVTIPWELDNDGSSETGVPDFTAHRSRTEKGTLRVLEVEVVERYVWEDGKRNPKPVELARFPHITVIKASQLRMPWDEFVVLRDAKKAERNEAEKASRLADERRKAEAKAKKEQREQDIRFVEAVLEKHGNEAAQQAFERVVLGG